MSTQLGDLQQNHFFPTTLDPHLPFFSGNPFLFVTSPAAGWQYQIHYCVCAMRRLVMDVLYISAICAMPEGVYPLIIVAVILTVKAFVPIGSTHRRLQEVSQADTVKTLKLQSLLGDEVGDHDYEGEWSSTKDARPLGFFEQTKGAAELEILSYAKDEQTNQIIMEKFGTLAIRLLDPQYRNKKVIYLFIRLADYEVSNLLWFGEQSIRVYTLDDHAQVNNISIQVIFLANLTNVQIWSKEINISIKMGPLQQHRELPYLMIIPSLLMLVLIQLSIRAQIPPQKLSLVTISIVINFLMYVSLLEIYRGIELEKMLIINGIVTFGVSARFTQTFEPAIRPINTLRGYMSFYCLSLVYFIGLFSYYHSRLFIVLQGLWLVPQIIHNMIMGLRAGFYPSYLGMVLVNQLYIFYIKGYSGNIFRESPEPWLCLIIVLLDVVQVLILYGQHRFGVKFFVPKRLRKNQHSYIKSMDSTNSSLDEDCAICLLPLKAEEPREDMSIQMETLREIRKIQIMETPCGHRFHVICLNHWMQHKLECPLDKRPLPPNQ